MTRLTFGFKSISNMSKHVILVVVWSSKTSESILFDHVSTQYLESPLTMAGKTIELDKSRNIISCASTFEVELSLCVYVQLCVCVCLLWFHSPNLRYPQFCSSLIQTRLSLIYSSLYQPGSQDKRGNNACLLFSITVTHTETARHREKFINNSQR